MSLVCVCTQCTQLCCYIVYCDFTHCTALDGTTVFQEKSEIIGRFVEHFDRLLNIPVALDVRAASAIHRRQKVHCLSEPPELKDAVDTIDATIEGKATGKRGIQAEIWK